MSKGTTAQKGKRKEQLKKDKLGGALKSQEEGYDAYTLP